jgi:hypothetical protein
MIPYYKKIDLDLSSNDWRFLNYLSHMYKDRVNPFHYNGKDNHEYKDFFLSASNNSYIDNPLFLKLSELFVSDSQYHSLEWIYRYSQISIVENFLPIHTDNRTCAISIPLLPIVMPVRWYASRNQDDVVCEYYYDNAVTLVNTRIFHGAIDNNKKRIFFQIGGFTEDFMDVLSHLKST